MDSPDHHKHKAAKTPGMAFKHIPIFLAAVLILIHASSPSDAIVRGEPVHGIALYGEPKYGPDFQHFEYVNPNAPKGGEFVKTNEAFLTFDTFNPYTLKGASAHGLQLLLYDTLMTPSQDEPASVYGLIAQTIEVANDNSWAEFVIRPGAKFTDGSAITADDVVFSFETMIADASPIYRGMYADIEEAVAIDINTVRFSFKTTENRKLPFLIAKYLPVLSQKYWRDRDFAETTLEIPVTNGPYVIDSFDPGKQIIYRRWDEYWGKDLPVNRGLHNFETVRFEYFRDDVVEFEAFKTNGYDFRREVSARRWATEYEFPAVEDGRVKTLQIKTIEPISVQPIFLNLRRPLFQDRRVRQALNYAFDFEALNANLFYDQYVRLRSYWQGSPLEATGLPSDAERELLEPYRDKIPPEVFTTEFVQPTNDGSGLARENLLKARDLLADAGWELRDDQLIQSESGQAFEFEMLIRTPSSERIFLPYIQNLKRLGIEATLRMVDTSQYINRLNDFDFDVVYLVFPHNDLTPGPEQYEKWGSRTADIPGSSNLSGVKDPVVDALIDHIVAAETYDEVTTATRALDRVLTWNYYQPLTFSSPIERYAYWTKLKIPEVIPALGIGKMGEFSTGMGESAIALWWYDEASDQRSGSESAANTEQNTGDPGSILWIMAFAAILVIGLVVIRRRRVRS